MATFKKFNKDKRPKRNTQSLLFKRKRFCRFTVAGVEEIDYKDVDTLRDFIGENGKIVPARHGVLGRQLAGAAVGHPQGVGPGFQVLGHGESVKGRELGWKKRASGALLEKVGDPAFRGSDPLSGFCVEPVQATLFGRTHAHGLAGLGEGRAFVDAYRSDEHTSELQSPDHLACRLLLEQKHPLWPTPTC